MYKLRDISGNLQNLDKYVTGLWVQTTVKEGIEESNYYSPIFCEDVFPRN